MTKRNSVFRFKQFECSHSKSSMKIGVDAVLIGAWAGIKGVRTILDVGTGCGIIALMCAQRNADAQIEAIDIDADSIAEAIENFNASPWRERLNARVVDFNSYAHQKFDLIISNPPYFKSGIDAPLSPRLKARHEDTLSPAVLLTKGAELLTDAGRIAMVLPADRLEAASSAARSAGLSVMRLCKVKGHMDAPVKRVLVEFARVKKPNGTVDHKETSCPEETLAPVDPEFLILEESPGVPTSAHRTLCADFYLYY
ncbi:MAG: methyltransferase [Muribaculaceae bacterium]|nr:methyltransferase [Muribaculaceae bacterium]